MQPVGGAREEINVIDFSSLVQSGLKGIIGMYIQTQYGEVGKPLPVGSVADFNEKFGGLLPNDYGSLMAIRCLQSGGVLEIARAAKYTDPTNKTTLTGTKASYAGTQSTVAAAGATRDYSLTTVPAGGGTISILVKKPGFPDITLVNALAVAPSATANATAAAINTAVNAGTGSHGFTSTNPGSPSANLHTVAPTALGEWGNNLKLVILPSTGFVFSGYTLPFSGGVSATVAAETITLYAANIGTWGTGITMTTAFSASNNPLTKDITIKAPGTYLTDESYTDMPVTGSVAASSIAALLGKTKILSDFTVSDDFVFTNGIVNLTSGADTSTMSPTDYIGDPTAGTGFYCFNETDEIVKLCVPAVADGTVDTALSAYAEMRKDILSLHRVPLGLTPEVALDYRNRSGAYSGIPIDSWHSLMFAGGLNIDYPVTFVKTDIPELGDVAGIMSAKDNNYFEWFSFAGEKRGTIKNANGVVNNVGVPAKILQYNLYDTNGIIPIIQRTNTGGQKIIVIQGNVNLYSQNTLLRKAETSELLVFMYRTLSRLIPYSTFDPNDMDTWKEIYKRVVPFIQYLSRNRALYNDPNTPDVWYQGDQNVIDISQIKINNADDVNAGKYKFNLLIKPIGALKYIELNIGVVNAGISFDSITV